MFWSKDIKRENSNSLKENKKCDCLIIGGGMTGITTAYYLKDFKNVIVVEANRIGNATTLRSTAKINYLQSGIYSKIKKMRGENIAKKYLKSQIYAIKNIKEIIESENIDCSFKQVPSFIYANTEKEIKKINREVEFLLNQGINIKKEDLPLKNSYTSFKVEDTYVFNPLMFLNALLPILKKSNVQIYENTKIVNIEYKNDEIIAFTDASVKIEAKKVIIATQYPSLFNKFSFPLKTYCEKSYIIVSKIAKKNKEYTCINSENPIYSCRFYEDKESKYQISLSESHNIAFSQNDFLHFKKVKKRFNLNDKDIVSCFSNIDIITPDALPYIGEYKKNIFIASGYNTWGMTNSILASKIISDNILNFSNPFENVFNPNRITLANIALFPYILFSQTKSFLSSKLKKNKLWYKGTVIFTKENGQNLGIYIDKLGKTHKIINKCPHLGCSLIFNEIDKTWDCPCHSSRFDVDGKCIKGPSNYDISCK